MYENCSALLFKFVYLWWNFVFVLLIQCLNSFRFLKVRKLDETSYYTYFITSFQIDLAWHRVICTNFFQAESKKGREKIKAFIYIIFQKMQRKLCMHTHNSGTNLKSFFKSPFRTEQNCSCDSV